jgi:hypothetical protein
MILTVITIQGSKLKTIRTQSELEKEIVSVKPILIDEKQAQQDKIAVVVLSGKQEISKSDYVFYECVSEDIANRGAKFATFFSGKESYVIKTKKGYIVVCDEAVRDYVNYKGKKYYRDITYPCIVAKIIER